MSYTHKSARNPDGIQVVRYEDMCRYFDYEEVRKVIRKEEVGNIIEGIVEGDAGVEKSRLEGALRMYGLEEKFSGDRIFTSSKPDSEGKFQEIFPVIDSDGKESSAYRIDLEKIFHFLDGMRSSSSKETIQQIIHCIDVVTYQGKVNLTFQQIQEILLFGVLFAYVQREPRDADIQMLQEVLGLDGAQAIQELLQSHTDTEIQEIKICQPSLELPCFMGKYGKSPLRLELAVLHNQLEQTVVVRLQDCPLQRHLKPKEDLMVLKANGQVVTFLPRVCMSRDWVVYQKERELVAEKGDAMRTIQLEREGRVFFSESDRYGFMIADRTGAFQGAQFEGKKPEGQICWQKGDLQNYGFLFSDGSYYGGLDFHKTWKSLLFFDLGGGCGVAVTADRCAINEKGIKLGDQVAAVSCCGEHYILLRMDGTVISDQGPMTGIAEPARAVCADAHGYWISTDDALLYWDGGITTYPQPLEEIERNNSGTRVGGISSENQICIITGKGKNS